MNNKFWKWFDHIGIPVKEAVPGIKEIWVPETQVWVTNPRTHPQRIEYVRSKDPRSPTKPNPENIGLWKLWNYPHVAYRVENLGEAIKGREVIISPFKPGKFATVAFVHKDGAIVEYLEYSNLQFWFDEPTPWVWL